MMDDGCLHPLKKEHHRYQSEICATSRRDLPFLCAILHDKLGLSPRYGNGRLHFGADDNEKIAANSGAWFPPELRYKLPKQAAAFDPKLYEPDYQPFYDQAVTSPFVDKENSRTVYCLRTETGNFATVSGIVHNCWDGTDRPVPDKRVQSCARWHLPRTLAEIQPEVLVLMGAAACRIADPLLTPSGEYRRLRLDLHRGIPQRGSVLGGLWSGWIWPMFEPALGMRDTPKMTQLLEDWNHFGKWLRGGWSPPEYEARETDYRIVREVGELDRYLDCLPAVLEMGLDTENHGPLPFSIQISHTAGTARMMLWEDRGVIREFARWVERSSTDWYLHYAPNDLLWCERMGVRLPRYYDTQQEAYELASLPQGLKQLAYRLFGVTMRSWEDIVLPASRDKLCQWMETAIQIAAQKLVDTEVTYYKRGVCPLCWHAHTVKFCGRCECCYLPGRAGLVKSKSEVVPGAAEKILRHILKFTRSTVDADEPYDPWEALDKMRAGGLRSHAAEEWEWREIEKEAGRRPILGIGNCPLDQALEYACGDADWEMQVARELRVRRASPRWEIDPADCDQPVSGRP